ERVCGALAFCLFFHRQRAHDLFLWAASLALARGSARLPCRCDFAGMAALGDVCTQRYGVGVFPHRSRIHVLSRMGGARNPTTYALSFLPLRRPRHLSQGSPRDCPTSSRKFHVFSSFPRLTFSSPIAAARRSTHYYRGCGLVVSARL